MADFSLTAQDVERLLADPSEQSRAATAVKVAEGLESQSLTAEERALADEILRAFAQDAAVAVRQAVVDSMKLSRQLPRDIAEMFAKDVESLALPLLQSSPMLSDPFLIAMVRQSGGAQQEAIAGRSQISDSIVTNLVEFGGEKTLSKLVANPGAEIAEHNMAFMLERFPASDAITGSLAARAAVPARIMEYLMVAASDAIKAQLKSRPNYQKQIDELLSQGRERATLRMLGRGRTDQELEDVARQLQSSQRLTASLVLRALCLGDLRFFEVCMATAAKVPLKNARVLIHDQGTAGLTALYGRSGLFPNFLPAVRHALEIAHETNFDGGPDDLNRYRRRLIERILTDPHGMMPEDIEYLLDKLSDLEASSRAA